MCIIVSIFFFFFFKQKTAYEMRISDWSSDVCSSDLLDQGARQLVGNAIQNAIIQGHGPSEAVNNLLNRGEPVPAALLKQRDIANAARAGRLAGEALMTGEGNPRANALRVFRTELNRAHGEAYMMGGEDHPDFGGWKFLLSPRHQIGSAHV